ncbi:MAG: M14 family zinc carboxypeptidase [Actinomycetota bacterium]
MRRTTLFVVLVMIVAMMGLSPGVSGAPTKQNAGLEMYRATVDVATFQELVRGGHDIASVEDKRRGVEVALVLSAEERDKLRRSGVNLEVWRDNQGRTQNQRAALQASEGFEVWRDWDGDDGIEAQIRKLVEDNPKTTALFDLGDSHEGRDILAVRVTKNAQKHPIGRRSAVLYQATTHAREWISTEVDMRLLEWFVEGNENKRMKRKLFKKTELWFIPVLNPDGYQYTFDEERLWRKNLRDNNGNGTTEPGDGVDLNRNYPEHWNYDEEGSSSEFASEVYRGPAPASEPETAANIDLFDMVDFEFAISYHSFGQLLLYPQGWQVQTPSADDPVYVALTGTDEDPAVEGFDPDLGAELYTTNGEFTDWAHGERDVLAWTPELSEGCDGCGFVFPDDETLVEEEFRRNLGFAKRVARSAEDPDDPKSHAGIKTRDLYLDVSKIDPHKTNNPMTDLTFDVSFAGGGDQPIDVLARRSARNVKLRYRINGGRTRTVGTSETPDGEVFGGNNAYNTHYRYLRGSARDLEVGDEVRYRFTSRDSRSAVHTFEVVEEADADVLILAAEDRTGATNLPAYPSATEPNYLSYYEAALQANGIDYDVYDVDAMGRTAPDQLGVLSHYDAVIWYTGNDLVTRQLGRGPGNVARLANDMMLEARQYLNEGGNLLYTGQWAGALENGLAGGQFYDPIADEECVVGGALVLDRCQLMSDKNDFLQYYLGAFLYNSDAGTDPATGSPFPVQGVHDPYTGENWEFNGADSAANQIHTASFLTTSSLLPPDEYPQFTSSAPAVWDTGAAGVFEPFDGDFYMYSQRADISYKRLMRTIDLTALEEGDPASMSFRTSYDTEPEWDFLFVEAHTVGAEDWTTLPDQNGHTSQDTGQSCAAGWFELHPWLEQYQGSDCSGSNPTTGGAWNASSGRSDGWEPWTVDLSDYAGDQVEVSISYASDWAIQGLGSFVDLIEVSTGEGSTSFEEDGDPMDGWTFPGPPEGSADNANDWMRTESVGFEEGAVVRTDDTLYFGFGFEGISGADSRASVMDKSIGYLTDD